MIKLIVGAMLVLCLLVTASCAPVSPPSSPLPEEGLPISTEVVPQPGDEVVHVSGMLPAFTTDDLIEHSDAIVIGKVTEILAAKWGEGTTGRIVYQDVIVQVERYLYGQPESERIVIRVEGGRIGNTATVVEDEPVFTLGEETLLFLHRPPYPLEPVPEGIKPLAYYKVTACMIGKFDHKDGIATGVHGRQCNVSTIEEKIATIHQAG